MDFIYDRNSNIIFSLHDSKVNEIKFHKSSIKFFNIQRARRDRIRVRYFLKIAI